MERRIDDGYSEFHWSHHSGGGWGLANEYHQWLADRGREFSTEPVEEGSSVQYGPDTESHQTTWCAEKAIEFMRAHQDDGSPWLFSVNFFDPHHRFDAPKEYLARYLERLDEIPLPNFREGELDDKPAWQGYDHAGGYGQTMGFDFTKMNERQHRLVRASYWAMCDLIDAQVGRIIDELARTGQDRNTLILFTSDHGEMLGDHGIYLKGPYFYEPAVHVPLIISQLGTVAPRKIGAMVELTDLAQTLLDAAGLEHHPGMQGKSLWPMLSDANSEDRHRDDVYCEYYNAMPWHKQPSAQATMVRTERYKLVAAHSLGTGELYDLEEDPRESYNHWADPDYERVKIQMLSRLCDRMAWTVDPLPLRKADW
jgi:arylsulfatase A-like enzyme